MVRTRADLGSEQSRWLLVASHAGRILRRGFRRPFAKNLDRADPFSEVELSFASEKKN
jgi:hypothetical protein